MSTVDHGAADGGRPGPASSMEAPVVVPAEALDVGAGGLGASSPSWVLRDVHALLAQIRDYAVITLDPEGTVLSWNAGAEHVKGYTAAEIVGTSFRRFYTEPDRRADLPTRILARAQQNGVAHSVGWRVRRDGSLFWADVTVSALREPGGALAGYVKVTRDITDQRLHELAQEQQHAAFTHDLRAPLTTAVGYLDLALEYLAEVEGAGGAEGADGTAGCDGPDRELDGPGRHLSGLLGHASRSLRRLNVMMERHLDASHAAGTAGTAGVEAPELLRIDGVVEATVQSTLEPAATERVQVRTAPDAQVAYVDRQALERALANVIGNAVKYSHDDVLVTTALLTTDAEPRHMVRIQVSDTGRGIHPDDLGTIFEPGERGRLARDDGGHGLGLNSVRQLITRQQGSVAIVSRLGEGTSVSLDLPVAPTD